MTISDKVQQVILSEKYNFCGIDFALYDTDRIRVYDNVDGVCIYENQLKEFIQNAPKELINKTYKKEELIKLKGDDNMKPAPFAICFYLEAPEKIEKPISMKTRYV